MGVGCQGVAQTRGGGWGGSVNCGKVAGSIQSNLVSNNELEVVNTDYNKCLFVEGTSKATVTHAQAQELGKRFDTQNDGGIHNCTTTGHVCNSSLSNSANKELIQSHNSDIGVCHCGSGQYRRNVLGVRLPCQHI